MEVKQALELVQLGWYIIPLCWPTKGGHCGCGSNHQGPSEIGKKPLIKEWPAVRADEDQVQAWWERWPNANAGVLLAPSKALVVDCDDTSAVEEAHRLGLDGGLLVSRGPHQHYWFKLPEGIHQGRAIKVQGKNLDILASGYVVAPGSAHLSGDNYVAQTGFSPTLLNSAPSWAANSIHMPEIQHGTAIPDALPEVDIYKIPLSSFVRDTIRLGEVKTKRSEACMSVIRALLKAGCDIGQIASVMLNPEHGISERYFEKRFTDEQRRRLLEYEVGKATTMHEAVEQAATEKRKEVEKPTSILRPWEDLLNDPPAEYLVEGLVPLGSVTILCGRPRSGKSMLARQLAVAVAGEKTFLGWTVKQNSKVVCWITLHSEGRPRHYADHLQSLGAKPQSIWVHFGPMQQWELWLEQSIVELGAKLLVVDTLRGLKAMDWNDYGPVTQVMDPLAKLAHKTGCAVVVLHHGKVAENTTGDLTRSFLGSTGIAASGDMNLVLERSNDDDDEENAPRVLRGVSRETADTRPCILSFDGVRFNNLGTKDKVKSRKVQDVVLSVLPNEPSVIQFSELKEHLEGMVGEKAARAALQKLEEEGIVKKVGGGSHTAYCKRCVRISNLTKDG